MQRGLIKKYIEIGALVSFGPASAARPAGFMSMGMG